MAFNSATCRNSQQIREACDLNASSVNLFNVLIGSYDSILRIDDSHRDQFVIQTLFRLMKSHQIKFSYLLFKYFRKVKCYEIYWHLLEAY